MVLDENLNFRSHNKHISKINSGIFVLRSLRGTSNSDVLLAAYYGIVYPHLEYAVPIWGHKTRDTVLLFKLQKRLWGPSFLCPDTSSAKIFSEVPKYKLMVNILETLKIILQNLIFRFRPDTFFTPFCNNLTTPKNAISFFQKHLVYQALIVSH